jgi:hypothetical protein
LSYANQISLGFLERFKPCDHQQHVIHHFPNGLKDLRPELRYVSKPFDPATPKSAMLK